MKTFQDLKELEGHGIDELRFYGEMVYIEQEKMQVIRSVNALKVRDISNAMKQGKTVSETTLFLNDMRDYQCPPVENYLLSLNMTDGEILTALLHTPEQLPEPENEFLTIRQKEHKAKDIFSPFAKPSKVNTASKWTVPKVAKAIMAGQVEQGHTDMVLTDDYAYDNAVNFRSKAPIPLYSFAKELTESPSGWWVHVDEENDKHIKLSVNCHHFDYKTLYIAV